MEKSKFLTFTELNKLKFPYIDWKYKQVGNPLIHIIREKNMFIIQSVFLNPNLSLDFVKRNIHLFEPLKKFYTEFSENTSITPDIISDNMDFP